MKPKAVPAYSPAFDEFWRTYPRRIAKLAAWKAWQGWACDGIPELLPALRLQLPAFCKRDIEHIPHPATWLNARRWEDEIAPQNANGAATRDATCWFHLSKFNHGKRAPSHIPTCGDCRHWEAANRARDSKVETSADALKRLGIG